MVAGYSVNNAFIVLSIVVIFLVVVSIPRREKWNNMAHFTFCGWSFVTLVLYNVSAVRWRSSVSNEFPRYCDFSTLIFVMYMMVVPAVALATSRRLFLMLREASDDREDFIQVKIYTISIDLGLCLGLPLVRLGLKWVFQGKSRYNIYEDYGCFQDIFNSPTSQLMNNLPELIIAMAALVYLALSISMWLKSDRDFDSCRYAAAPEESQQPSQRTGVTPSRFYRHAVFATICILLTFVFTTWKLVINLGFGEVYSGINEVDHVNSFSEVFIFSAAEWQDTDLVRAATLEISRWTVIALTAVFYLLFGPMFSTECQECYYSSWKCLVAFDFDKFLKASAPSTGSFKLPFGLPMTFQDKSSQERQASADAGSLDKSLPGLPVWLDSSVFPSKPTPTYPSEHHILPNFSFNGKKSSSSESFSPPPSPTNCSKPLPLPLYPPPKSTSGRSIVTTPSLYSVQSAARPKSSDFHAQPAARRSSDFHGVGLIRTSQIDEDGSFLDLQTPPNTGNQWLNASSLNAGKTV